MNTYSITFAYDVVENTDIKTIEETEVVYANRLEDAYNQLTKRYWKFIVLTVFKE